MALANSEPTFCACCIEIAAATAISRSSTTTTPNNLRAIELRAKRDGATEAAAVAARGLGGEMATVTSLHRTRRHGVATLASRPVSCRSAQLQWPIDTTPG